MVKELLNAFNPDTIEEITKKIKIIWKILMSIYSEAKYKQSSNKLKQKQLKYLQEK